MTIILIINPLPFKTHEAPRIWVKGYMIITGSKFIRDRVISFVIHIGNII
jgi:hypothetical protein